MPDHREPESADRSRAAAGRTRTEGGHGTPSRPDPVPPGRRSKEAAIKAVSDVLILKKPALDRTSARAQFPKFPQSIESTILDLKKSPSLRAKLGAARTTLGPPPVALPGGGSLVEGPSAEPPEAGAPESTVGVDRPRPFSIPTDPAGRGPEVAVPTPEPRGLASELGSSSTPNREGRGSPGASIDPGASPPPVAPGTGGRLTFRDLGPAERAGIPVEQDGPSGAIQAPSVDLPREGRPPAGSGTSRGPGATRAAGPASGAISPTRIASSTVAVRSPLAFGPGRLSAAPQDFTGPGGTGDAPEPTGAGSGSDGPSFGGPATARGGGSIDLSRTNEILRQLLDAVKKQRDASLPVGGQSVFPGR